MGVIQDGAFPWLAGLLVNGELEGMSGRSPCDFSSVDNFSGYTAFSPPSFSVRVCVCVYVHAYVNAHTHGG